MKEFKMREVARTFIGGTSRIYIVSNGVIFSQTFEDFKKVNTNGWEKLINSGDNVGWNKGDSYLMVTDDDKIYRVDGDMFAKLCQGDSSRRVGNSKDKYMRISYSISQFSDEFLHATIDYKKELEALNKFTKLA
ncbi:MAG: hypothetical protein NC131_18570 [Roseburia sp.]|nr:hypothetical protein [Roseburia sp.]